MKPGRDPAAGLLRVCGVVTVRVIEVDEKNAFP